MAKRKPKSANPIPPKPPHAKPAWAKPHWCWRKTRQGGICEVCRFIPKDDDEAAYKHKGKCHECGGQMRCRQPKMPSGACKMHGGKSPPPGPGHHAYVDGTNSKFPSVKNLSERIKEASENPHLMELPRHVSTLEARISELTEALEVGGTGNQWAQARELFTKLDQATRGGEHDELLDGLRSVLFDGESRAKMWQELKDTIASQVRIIESHRKGQTEAGHMILLAQHIMSLERLANAPMGATSLEDALLRMRREFAILMGVYDQPASSGAIEAEAVQA